MMIRLLIGELIGAASVLVGMAIYDLRHKNRR